MNDVPYIVHEDSMVRMERINKRQWIVILILIFLLVGSNIAWLIHEAQFGYFEITQESDTGTNNYIGNDGEISYGKTSD